MKLFSCLSGRGWFEFIGVVKLFSECLLLATFIFLREVPLTWTAQVYRCQQRTTDAEMLRFISVRLGLFKCWCAHEVILCHTLIRFLQRNRPGNTKYISQEVYFLSLWNVCKVVHFSCLLLKLLKHRIKRKGQFWKQALWLSDCSFSPCWEIVAELPFRVITEVIHVEGLESS